MLAALLSPQKTIFYLVMTDWCTKPLFLPNRK